MEAIDWTPQPHASCEACNFLFFWLLTDRCNYYFPLAARRGILAGNGHQAPGNHRPKAGIWRSGHDRDLTSRGLGRLFR